jgi:ABC-type uncharacterized transport system substrate-binding protein
MGTPVTVALQQQTRTIPIVCTLVADPVASGLAASLAHPGANITGFTNYEYTIGGKWVEALKESAPGITRILAIQNPANAGAPGLLREIEAAARSLAVQVTTTSTLDAAGMEGAIEAFAREPNSGLIVLPHNLEPSRVNRGAGGASSLASDLPVPILCPGRRHDVLRHRHRRSVSTCGVLCRSHSKRRQSGRPAGRPCHQVRACH